MVKLGICLRIAMMLFFSTLIGCAANEDKSSYLGQETRLRAANSEVASAQNKDQSSEVGLAKENKIEELEIYIYPQHAGDEGYSIRVDID